MVLVDSSIWIGVERGDVELAVLVPEEEIIATCPTIVHEVLRGAREAKKYQLAREMLMATEILDSPTSLARFVEAANVYHRCRFAGFTPSLADCLIAACAIANRVPLLHQDVDFNAIASATTLRLFTRP